MKRSCMLNVRCRASAAGGARATLAVLPWLLVYPFCDICHSSNLFPQTAGGCGRLLPVQFRLLRAPRVFSLQVGRMCCAAQCSAVLWRAVLCGAAHLLVSVLLALKFAWHFRFPAAADVAERAGGARRHRRHAARAGRAGGSFPLGTECQCGLQAALCGAQT